MVRLTSLAHGGGCGCKLAPSVLQQLLADQPAAAPFKQLLVGTETADDAAVWQLDDNTCIIATTDFFMPMVDDPYDFGRIAATNAISDVYAMGGKPIMALAILGMPVDKIPTEMVREILKGGAAVCASAGIPVAGGHSIDCPEPVYGLAVIGTCRPEHVRRNADAKAGDALDPDQADRRRHLLGRHQEGRAAARRLHRDDRHHDAAQPGRRASWRKIQTCTPSPTSPASACSATRLEMARGSKLAITLHGRRRAPADAGRDAGPGGLRHRRVAPQLVELRRGRQAAGGLPRLAPPPADRSADLRRPAGRVRARVAPPRSCSRSAKPATPPRKSSATPTPATLPSSSRTEPAAP